jgi:acetyl-CoA carboxylase biotin carboxyl carrier protein
MTDPTEIDAALVKTLATLLDETRLTEIEYAKGELRIRVTRQPAPTHVTTQAAPPAVAAPAAAPIAAAPPAENLSAHPGAVRSPMVGTAYLSPQPGAPPFVRVGDTVAMGETLLIIEAMKVMNQIRAPKAGRVTRILVEDAGPVEFGQVAMLIE